MRTLLVTPLCWLVLSNLVTETNQSGDLGSAVFSKTAVAKETDVKSPNLTGLLIFQSASQGPPFTFPKFDEYGNLSLAQERKRLNYFAEELRSVPGESGYIIEYRRKGQRQKRLTRARRAKDYLVKLKKISAERIAIVDGGFHREFKIELRLGPLTQK